MIICPTCKEEIDDDSRYCDQCGQSLLYCSTCGRVGKGRRCTYCGGLMVGAAELNHKAQEHTSLGNFTSLQTSYSTLDGRSDMASVTLGEQAGIPVLTLYNSNLNIRIVGVNGALIGRRQGPYTAFFESNMYVSGVHAQLSYSKESGWSITDKHSSNGTKLNAHELQPDVPMSLKSGDIVSIANVNLQVSIT